MSKDGRAWQAMAGTLEPLVSSGTMFLVQGAVLMSVSKPEFASYSLAYSYVVMGQAVLSALFGGPLITLLGDLSDEYAREKMGAAALRMQLLVAVMLGAAGLSVALTIGLPYAIATLAVISMIGLSFRDALRSVFAARLQLGRALEIALWFAGVTAFVLGAVWLLTRHVTAEGGLAALATGALGTLAWPITRTLTSGARLSRDALRRLMGMAAWSVPGAAVIWLQNSFYLTLMAETLSLDAVGEVSAARIVAMPILIATSGLLRVAQVQATRKLASGGLRGAINNAQRLALVSLAAGATLAAACWVANSAIDHRWLPPAYPHVLTLAAVWLGFAGATTARGVYSSLFQAMARYREIFVLNLLVLPFVLVGIAFGPVALGLPGAVLPMVAGELVLLVLLFWRARRPSAAAA